MGLHLIKLCVGCDSVDELLAWRRETSKVGQPWVLRTKQTPKRSRELLEGGSLYRVYKGYVLSRQRILSVATIGDGVARRCEIELDDSVVLTLATPRRAFQGWRYLDPTEAPPDLDAAGVADVPMDLAKRLRELGAW